VKTMFYLRDALSVYRNSVLSTAIPCWKYRFSSNDRNSVLWGSLVIITSVFQRNVLSLLHDSHPGIVRMKRLARSYVWWPNMDCSIENSGAIKRWSRGSGLPIAFDLFSIDYNPMYIVRKMIPNKGNNSFSSNK